MAETLVEIDGLTRAFGGRVVVRDLDLRVAAGDRVGLVGPNGSGKTTVIRCVAGTLSPTSGRIVVAGRPAGSMEARRAVGVSLSQERSFYLRLSGRENLLFFARLRIRGRRAAAAAVAALVEELELSSFVDRPADEYSTGMGQQLAFARALLGSPRLLLLDEPTRSLDVDAVGRLWRAIDRRPGLAVVVATHSGPDLERCPRTVDLGAS